MVKLHTAYYNISTYVTQMVAVPKHIADGLVKWVAAILYIVHTTHDPNRQFIKSLDSGWFA